MLTQGAPLQGDQPGNPLRLDTNKRVKPIQVDIHDRRFYKVKGRYITCYVCGKGRGNLQKDDKGYYHPRCKR